MYTHVYAHEHSHAYMLVNARTVLVRAVCERLFCARAGADASSHRQAGIDLITLFVFTQADAALIVASTLCSGARERRSRLSIPFAFARSLLL